MLKTRKLTELEYKQTQEETAREMFRAGIAHINIARDLHVDLDTVVEWCTSYDAPGRSPRSEARAAERISYDDSDWDRGSFTGSVRAFFGFGDDENEN